MNERARLGMLACLMGTVLIACGGGGGGGGGDASSGGASPSPNPGPGPVGNDLRLASGRYDYDANGTDDATDTYTYDAQGRVTQRRYVYTGDGTADRQALYGDKNDTVTLSYADDQRVAVETQVRDDGSGWRFTFSYDASGRVTRTDSDSLGAGGAVIQRASTEYAYNSGRMTLAVMRDGGGSELMRQTIDYDAATGLPTQMRRGPLPLNQHYAYQWNSDATLAQERQDVNGDGVFDQTTDYTYGGGRLVRTAVVFAGLYASQKGYSFLFSYSGAGAPERIDVDLGSDGSVDAIHRPSYQSAACRAVVLPVVFPFVTADGFRSQADANAPNRAYCAP
jgi:hypothetical protein